MNWKFEIGQKTDKGIIRSRYYQEWKNRNGDLMTGLYYVMEDGKSFNEILIEPKK